MVVMSTTAHLAKAATNEEPATVTYVSQANDDDSRAVYEGELLNLALELTREKYGDFKLVPAPQGITHARARESMRRNRYPNFIRSFAYREELSHAPNFRYIEFPVYRGLLGYRVCFVPQNKKEEIAKADTFEKLKAYVHGQGVGWSDTRILREAGFRVKEISNYESLFTMVNINRIDMFCRGVSEYLPEAKKHQHLENLAVDETFSIYYSFPLYLHAHKDNQAMLNRIYEGLLIAYENGSFIELWERFFKSGIEESQLHKRKVYTIENRTLDGLVNNYDKYMYRHNFDEKAAVSSQTLTQ